MTNTFTDKKNNSSQKAIFITGPIVILLLLFSAAIYIFKLSATNTLLHTERNVQELRIDSLLAVKLLVDKELAYTKAALVSVQAENQKLQIALTEAKASVTLSKHTMRKLLQKRANKNNFIEQPQKAKNSNLQQQARIQVRSATKKFKRLSTYIQITANVKELGLKTLPAFLIGPEQNIPDTNIYLPELIIDCYPDFFTGLQPVSYENQTQ